ncbi:MAG: dihydroneopterin aldolase [Thermoanaerobaculia bacterium]
MTADRVFLEELWLEGIVGVHDWERHEPQEIRVSLELFLDLEPAGRTDELAATLDYEALAAEVRALVARSSFQLVEALAEAIAAKLLLDPRVEKVAVRVSKPRALPEAAAVGVEIERRRPAQGR